MNSVSNRHLPGLSLLAVTVAFAIFHISARSEDAPGKALSAQDLAARLSANRQNGASYVRLRMEVKQPATGANTVLQLQIKARRTNTTTDVVYQVLWPKERKGESVLLRQSAGRTPTGTLFSPPDTLRSIDASQMKDPVFGSDLSYEDFVENFFAWKNQSLAGVEIVDGVNCQILESTPAKGDTSTYARVRSWIDTTRLVPLRVEKYSASGKVARRITTTRVAHEEGGRYIPATLVVQRPGQDSVTELEGSRNRLGMAYADRDFTPEGLRDMTAPRSSPE